MQAPANSEAKREEIEPAATLRRDPPREIELKLLAPAEALDRIRKAPIIHRHAVDKGVTLQLATTYYDTPERLLSRHGLSLRVRHNGGQRVQTVKRTIDGNALARNEWEAPIEADRPDLGRLPLAEIGAPLDTLDGEGLVALFETRIRRHQLRITMPDAVIEMAFDEGEIVAGERSEPVSEIELELKSGDAGALYQLGLLLLGVAPLRVGASSKAARGYALAFGLPPATVKATPAGIRAEDTVDEAVAKLLRSCQGHLMANLAATERGDDPEGPHQLRVALRRLRTALAILRRDLGASSVEALNIEAKELARTVGPARGWDVFVTETLADIDDEVLPEAGREALRRAAEPLRAASHAAVREALAAPATNRFLLALGRTIERRSWHDAIARDEQAILAEPVAALAARALDRIQQRALRQGRHFGRLSPEKRHRLRLTLKKLRYAAEFFRPVYVDDGADRKYLDRLSKLQNVLGAANDLRMMHPLLDEIERSAPGDTVHRAVAAVVDWQSSRHQRQAEKRLVEAWRRFKKVTPFWSDL